MKMSSLSWSSLISCFILIPYNTESFSIIPSSTISLNHIFASSRGSDVRNNQIRHQSIRSNNQRTSSYRSNRLVLPSSSSFSSSLSSSLLEENISISNTNHHSTSQNSNLKSTSTHPDNIKTHSLPTRVEVSFSHIHLYVDKIQSIQTYKKLESTVNNFDKQLQKKIQKQKQCRDDNNEENEDNNNEMLVDLKEDDNMNIEFCRQLWNDISSSLSSSSPSSKDMPSEVQGDELLFESQNRDIIKQLICGLGFRITGLRYGDNDNNNNNNIEETSTLLLTTRDPKGVQIVVSSLVQPPKTSTVISSKQQQRLEKFQGEQLQSSGEEGEDKSEKEYTTKKIVKTTSSTTEVALNKTTTSATSRNSLFNPLELHDFFKSHSGRQGIAVLGFEVLGCSKDNNDSNNNNDHDNNNGNDSISSDNVNNKEIHEIYSRYQKYHPNLIVNNYKNGPQRYCCNKNDDNDNNNDNNNGGEDNVITYVFEVYAYYQEYNDDDNKVVEMEMEEGKKLTNRVSVADADTGTKLRFVQVLQKSSTLQSFQSQEKKNSQKEDDSSMNKEVVAGTTEVVLSSSSSSYSNNCILPGLETIQANFELTSMPAYCDHWVSNVFSRQGFIQTLEDTLGFTPKVDFNAGVVAAGEAQIESTVTGNDPYSTTSPTNGNEDGRMTKKSALQDQSQVYLPINNALSEVGHVHGFLKEIGQGIQHVASRVDDLAKFVQRANDYRKITGEGFTFLNIPRSYYGILNSKQLEDLGLSHEITNAILIACVKDGIMSPDGAVDLSLSMEFLDHWLDSTTLLSESSSFGKEMHTANTKDQIVKVISRSRYLNLYSLLGDHLSESSYLKTVRNKILVDVQGDDLLFQIFTSNILQRKNGEESPFFEFIQRVCSECVGGDGCPAEIKPGCGGFGIRNFLTLFLSIELSKAMSQVVICEENGDVSGQQLSQRMVDIFTEQLEESNPILTEIADAMTEEGKTGVILRRLEQEEGDKDAIIACLERVKKASTAKAIGNEKLMACSKKYKDMMKSLRTGAIGIDN